MEHRIIFNTRNLRVRPLMFEDIAEFHRLQNDIRVMKYSTGRVMSKQDNRRDLDRVIRAYKDLNNGFWVWAIETRADSVFVGTGALVLEQGLGIFEVGIRLLPDHWGKGYGKEIILSLICHAFAAFEAKACSAYVDQENERSRKILDRYLSWQGEIENMYGEVVDHAYLIDLDSFLSQGHSEEINQGST